MIQPGGNGVTGTEQSIEAFAVDIQGGLGITLGLQAKESKRDPFWPVGFTNEVKKPDPPKPTPTPIPDDGGENVVPDIAGETGVLSDVEKAIVTGKSRPAGYLRRKNSQFLYINGEMLTTGEKLIVRHNGKKHAFTITEFKDRSVVLKAH